MIHTTQHMLHLLVKLAPQPRREPRSSHGNPGPSRRCCSCAGWSGSRLAGLPVLWVVDVDPGPAHERHRVRGLGVADLRHQPRVAELCVEGLVQHHVARLDIPVQEEILTLALQVYQAGGYSDYYVVPETRN